MGNIEEALKLATQGKLEEAKAAFEDALMDNPRDADALYNLGMCFTDLGQPDKAIVALNKALEHNPNHSNTHVALGYAYSRLENNEKAKEHLVKACAMDPDNPYALRNLGGVYGKLGDLANSAYCLKKAYSINPSDPATVYGLAYTYQQAGDLDKAEEYYKKVLMMEASAELKEKAKTGLSEVAIKNMKAKGFRMDAVMYMLTALQLFKVESLARVREITFEIALKGMSGLDINNPDRQYKLNNLPGQFSGLQLVSYMYAGFQIIAPEQDTGVDLSEEYKMALKLFESKEVI